MNVANVFFNGTKPLIRYMTGGYSEEFANELNRQFTGPSSKNVLLVLDRRYDMVTPLSHNMDYQSLIKQYISFENETIYTTTEQIKKSVEFVKRIIDDKDNVWCAIRHLNISVVGNELEKLSNELNVKFPEFAAFDKASKSQKKELLTPDIIIRQKEYNARKAIINMHAEIAVKIIDNQNVHKFQNTTLTPYLSNITQELCENPSNVNNIENINTLLRDQTIPLIEKQKIILICFLTLPHTQFNNIVRNLPKPDFEETNKIIEKIRNMKVPLCLLPVLLEKIMNDDESSYSSFPIIGDRTKLKQKPKSTVIESKFKKPIINEIITNKDTKILVFIIGGYTYAESKYVFDSVKKLGVEISISGTSIIKKNNDFINTLKSIAV